MEPAQPAAAAAAEGSPEVLEVRCAGCGETLEVGPGLTEFICPDCARRSRSRRSSYRHRRHGGRHCPCPRRRRRPGREAAVWLLRGASERACRAGALRLPNLRRRARRRHCAAPALPPVIRRSGGSHTPIGTTSAPPILQAREVQQEHPNFGIRTGLMRAEPDNQLNCMEQARTKRPNQLIPEQEEVVNPDYMVVREEVRDVNGIVTRHSKQIDKHSVGPGIVSVEKRQEEPLNHVRHQAQVQSSSYAFHPKQAHIDRVIEAQTNSITSAVFRESGCIAPSKETTATRISCTTGRPIALQTVNIEKRQSRTLNQIIQQAQKQSSSYSTCPEHAQAEDADGVIHVQEKQQEHVNQANHTEEACTRLGNETIAGDSNRRRVGCSAGPDSTGVEKRKVQEANEAVKKVQKQQPNSVIHMELENQMMCVENEQSKSFSCRPRKRKKKGLIASSNSSLQLRRSKRLAKDSPASIDQEPDKNEFLSLPASPNGQASDAVMDTEPIHREAVESQAVTSTGRMSAAIADSESTESEPDEQHAASPDQSLSDSPDIDRIINDLCPSSSPPYEMPQTSSNELDNLHSTTPPSASSSHLDMSDPEQFACNYIPPEVRKALAKLRSNSLFEHTMSQASSGEACLHDLTDSEGGSPWIPTRQNIGTKRNQGHIRGLTLS